MAARAIDLGIDWYPLEWDSAQYGFPAARLEIRTADRVALEQTLDDCGDHGIRHLITRVSAENRAAIRLLERAGFELLDGLQTFALPAGRICASNPPQGLIVRKFQPADLPQVLEIARLSYTHDRFHADSALPAGLADRINERWVENCCAGAMADVVMVAERENKVFGFVTVSLRPVHRQAVIGMVAVDESCRRRGVARAITAECLQWAVNAGAAEIRVGTQLANVAAARLYQSFGFLTTAVEFTFRRIL